MLNGLVRFGVAAALLASFNVRVSAAETVIAPPSGNQTGVVRYIPDDLFGVDFIDQNQGWVTGYYGSLLRTGDGGGAWAVSSIGQPDLIRRIDFVDPKNGWAVGHRGGIFVTTDGGESWAVQHNETGANMRDISFVDSLNGWAVGHNQTILHTINGGGEWIRQEFVFEGLDPPRISGVAAYSPQEAIAVGEFGLIVSTNDGGLNWTRVMTPNKGTYTAVAVTSDHAIAVGIDGLAVQVPRGGTMATLIPTNTRLHLLDIALDSSGNGFAVGLGSAYRISKGELVPVKLEVAGGGELAWLGGVGLLPDGGAVAVGSRGLIATWNAPQAAFVQAATWR